MSKRRTFPISKTTVIFSYDGFSYAPNPSAFQVGDIFCTNNLSFISNLRLFYNSCALLEDQINNIMDIKVSDVRINIMFAQYSSSVNSEETKIRRDFNKSIGMLKVKYKSQTGKKNTRGLKDTKEYKTLLKKRDEKIRNIRKKGVSTLISSVKGSISKPSNSERGNASFSGGFRNITFPAFDEIFYRALSYGSKGVKRIQADILSGRNQGVYFIELSDVTIRFLISN